MAPAPYKSAGPGIRGRREKVGRRRANASPSKQPDTVPKESVIPVKEKLVADNRIHRSVIPVKEKAKEKLVAEDDNNRIHLTTMSRPEKWADYPFDVFDVLPIIESIVWDLEPEQSVIPVKEKVEGMADFSKRETFEEKKAWLLTATIERHFELMDDIREREITRPQWDKDICRRIMMGDLDPRAWLEEQRI